MLPEKFTIGAWELTRRVDASQAECLFGSDSNLALATLCDHGTWCKEQIEKIVFTRSHKDATTRKVLHYNSFQQPCPQESLRISVLEPVRGFFVTLE